MTYESKSFKEHHLTRLPVLERLLLLGWEREQIICPSPNSDDTEWHVPKTPSEATNRESKRSFKGYPVDIALFDDVEFVNDYEHIVAIIECKEPNKNEGISQLKIYLGLEPHARLGIWTNGTEFVAVIVDNNRVAFAYIGEYYEEQSPTLTVELEKEVHQQIEKANPNTDTFTCPYIKRRKITLIKVLTADDTISPYLQSAIARNWHSLSDLNEYAELVLSGCFDTVLFKDKLTVTFRVKRKEEINVLDLANFVLCAARLLSDDKPETVQVKTTLHSPGDVILQIWNFAQENAFPLLICYMAIFGGKARDYEFHSIIGVIKGIINHKYDEDKKKIELRKLSAEADLAEQQALKQKLENIETMRRLQLSSVDAYAEPLATAAKNLAVQPSSATIIDITKILKSQQEDQPPQ